MSSCDSGNIFEGLKDAFAGEAEVFSEEFEQLAAGENVRIERIVSKGHCSPENFWYDQPDDEWVILLSGAAELEFENGKLITMHPGDWINIPAHKRHRVKSTHPDTQSVWLAVHYRQ